MANIYNWSRIEPLCTQREVNGQNECVVESIVVGLTATSEETGLSQYIDTMVATPLDPENFHKFESLDQAWALAIAEGVAEERKWRESLDRQLEAAAARPVSRPFSWQKPVEEPAPADG